ncbi:MAG: ABC transporter substrate-binding protein [Lachnospiraceae bacterium]|nr:ABC transporter substrate-binding protein [Lachnospiraceae bacterium]
MDENTPIQWTDLIKTDSMDLTYATQFAVDYYQDDYTLITIAGQQKYLLLPDDSAGNIPEDLPDDIVVLKRNPQRVYIASSSCMDFWRELDELDAVWFTSTKRQDWDLPEAAERMTDGDLEFVGKYNAPDFEYLLAEKCGLAVENTMIYHTPDTLEKLESLGIPVLVEYSSYEESPLGRLEWIRLWGLLTGREKDADAFFDEQVKQVSKLMETAGSSAIDNGNSAVPRIVYFSINANGVIRVPKPSSYIPALIEMAGGKYALADADLTDDSQNAASSMNMQMEDFYVLAKDADVLIYNGTIEGNLASIDDLIAKNALFKDFSAVKNHRVWCQDGDLFQHPTAVAEEVAAFGEVIAGQDANETDGGKFLQKLE